MPSPLCVLSDGNVHYMQVHLLGHPSPETCECPVLLVI